MHPGDKFLTDSGTVNGKGDVRWPPAMQVVAPEIGSWPYHAKVRGLVHALRPAPAADRIGVLVVRSAADVMPVSPAHHGPPQSDPPIPDGTAKLVQHAAMYGDSLGEGVAGYGSVSLQA